MSIQFILGRAGSGKTQLCLDQLTRQLNSDPDGPALILLVPDQATFQLEQALVSGPGVNAVTRAGVYSFRRLAWRIIDAVGGLPHPHIGPMGKLMLIRKILLDRRRDLQLFTGPVRPGTAAKISSLLSEFAAADCYAAQITRLAARCRPQTTLAAKLHDLAVISADMEDRLAGRHSDPDHLLTAATTRVSQCDLLRGAVIWVDGFAGFTVQELQMLQSLWECSSMTRIALCLDPDDASRPAQPGSLFYPCHRTFVQLLDLAADAGIEVLPPLQLCQSPLPRYRQACVLARIESDVMTGTLRDDVPETGSVLITAAANRRAEVEAAAAHIISLVRDHDYRWQDISVLVRSLDGYGSLIKNVFADYGIPAFIDRLRPIIQHPVVQLVRSTLELATDGRQRGITAILRTGLVAVDPDIVDRLDNDARAYGGRAKHWLSRTPISELETIYRSLSGREIVQVRRAIAPVARCCRKLEDKVPIREAVQCLFVMMQDLEVPHTLAAWSEHASCSDDAELALEHRRIWSGLVDLADQLVAAAGDDLVTVVELELIIDAGLRGLRVGLIPAALDQVVVGAVDRSRQPPVNSTLVLGCNEGLFFAPSEEDLGLTDNERECISELGIEVGMTARERAFAEPYLAYIALTRAKADLWVSYVLADDSGRPQLPARLIDRLCTCCGVKINTVGPDGDSDWQAVTGRSALRDLLPKLRSGTAAGRWAEVCRWASGHSEYEWLLSAASYDGSTTPLSPQLAAGVSGDRVFSVTALEHYGDCPFRFFARYFLRLKRRKTADFQPFDRGNLVHSVLTEATPKLVHAIDSGQCNDAVIEQLVDEELDVYLARSGHVLQSSLTDQMVLQEIRSSLYWALWLISIHCQRSDFRPQYYEWGFSPSDDDRGVNLRGRVDRIDTAVVGDINYIRVIEYKTGRAVLDLSEVLFGLSLQLPLYMDRVLSGCGGNAAAAGMLSFRVKEPRVRYERRPDPEDLLPGLLSDLRPQGLIAADPLIIRLMDNEVGTFSDLIPAGVKKDGQPTKRSTVITPEQMQHIIDLVWVRANQFVDCIDQGQFPISPARYKQRSTCSYCEYRPLCGYDPQLPGHKPRRLAVDGDVWELIREVVAGGRQMDE